MIKVVMFDLGMTLLDAGDQPFPHVQDALTFVAGLPLRSCLVSDFDMAIEPTVAMAQYEEILKNAQLDQFFHPLSKRVTLSNHAGVKKPNRKIFEKALERLGGTAVAFTDCLFVTENHEHILAAKNNLQMSTLQFGLDFFDWSSFPEKLAEIHG